jgi:hypothetical protein
MVSETIYLLSSPLGRELIEDFDNTCVQHPPPLLEQAAVGHFVDQGVLEHKLTLGEQPRLVEELGRLQVGKATLQVLLGQLGNGL